MLTVVPGTHPAKPLLPLTVSRTVPVVPPVPLATVSRSTAVSARAPPKVTVYPVSATVPTEATAPTGRRPFVPLTVSATVPVAPPVPLVRASSSTSVPWNPAPPNVTVYPVSLTAPTATVPPAGQPAPAAPPLAI